jgi:hypothetical protein
MICLLDRNSVESFILLSVEVTWLGHMLAWTPAILAKKVT